MKREHILEAASVCVRRDREATYGSPEDNFGKIASYWQIYLRSQHPDTPIHVSPADVAVMMILTKISRIAKSPEHTDNWIDIAGYAACGGEIATKSAE